MDEEHTHGTIINYLQIVVFMYLFVHVFYYVFNEFRLQSVYLLIYIYVFLDIFHCKFKLF